MHALQLPGCAPWKLAQGYGHGERIFDVSFHPFSEDIVLTASEDTSVRMWRRAEGSTTFKQARAFLGHSAEALRVAWSANGLLLASGSADRTVRLWAADLNDQGYTGRQLAVLDGHPEEVYYVEFVDPTAASSASVYGNGGVRQGLPGGGGDGGAVSLPPFETHVLVASSESLFVWSLQEGAVVQQANAPGTSGSTITHDDVFAGTARPAYIFSVARQPAGSLVAAACSDGAVRLWSLRPTGHLEWAGQMVLPGAPCCTGCAFAGDSSTGSMTLGVATREGQMVELDLRTLKVLSSRPLPSSPLTLAHLPPAAPHPGAQNGDGAAGAVQGAKGTWLAACRDGAVYEYGVDEQPYSGSPPLVLLRSPPASPQSAAVLALAVAPGGLAVAMGGEPQDASLLPPLRQQAVTSTTSQPSATAPSCNGSPTANGSTPTPLSDSAPPLGERTGSPASSPATTTTPPPLPSRPSRPHQGVPTTAAAPPRRRSAAAGSRFGRVVAGGLAARGPLALLDESGGDMEAVHAARDLAGLALDGDDAGRSGARHRGRDQQPARPQGARGGAQQKAGEEREMREAVGHHGAEESGSATRMRAPLLVYVRAHLG